MVTVTTVSASQVDPGRQKKPGGHHLAPPESGPWIFNLDAYLLEAVSCGSCDGSYPVVSPL